MDTKDRSDRRWTGNQLGKCIAVRLSLQKLDTDRLVGPKAISFPIILLDIKSFFLGPYHGHNAFMDGSCRLKDNPRIWIIPFAILVPRQICFTNNADALSFLDLLEVDELPHSDLLLSIT